jgi:uncharacterized protein YcbK (DUF882 family)
MWIRLLLILFFFLFPLKARCEVTEKGSASSNSSTVSEGSEKNTQKKKPLKTSKKRGKKQYGRCSGHASPKYRRMVRRWQKKPKLPKTKYRDGFRDVTILSVNHGESVRVFPFLADGTLDPEVLVSVKRLLRDKHTDAEHDIHPRLIKLLYHIVDRFDAKQINVISGFRESTDERSESKHKKGQAVDFMIPGVPLGAVAREARKLGHVGVGFYPNSGFVHLDVRNGPSYFWIDRSGPGRGPCTRRALTGFAAKTDRKWKPEKDEPKPHKNKKGELLGTTQKAPSDKANGG